MILAIASGGAIGAVLRYLIYGASFTTFGHDFPFGTMIVNIIGSFCMGSLISFFDLHWEPSPELKLFLMTGFLGALTTFSNFSMDAVLMFEKGEWFYSSLYVAGSVFLSIMALFAGLFIIRQIYT
jgi:CrcB protein